MKFSITIITLAKGQLLVTHQDLYGAIRMMIASISRVAESQFRLTNSDSDGQKSVSAADSN